VTKLFEANQLGLIVHNTTGLWRVAQE